MFTALEMLVLRFIKKSSTTRTTPFFQLVFGVVVVCFSIYAWKVLGCFGIPDCYLCRKFIPDLRITPVINTSDDFARLMNLTDFTFLMNNFVCNDTDLLLLVLVHSSPNNFSKRWTIRNTWGREFKGRSKLLFLFGVPSNDTVQKLLNEENDIHQDIVQGNFADSYRNLTYKHVMAFKWKKYFCPNAKYILKTDDDVFVNSPSFLKYVTKVPETGVMRCLPVYDGKAQRTWRSKWRVSHSEYQYRRYPTFCQGFAILYTPDVVETLYAKAQISKYFWIDDVFITGFLAASTNYTPSTFGKYMLEPEELAESLNSEVFSYLLGPFNLKAVDIRKLWEKAMKTGYVTGVDS